MVLDWTSLILTWHLNVAIFAGTWWIVLRLLEQSIKVYRLYKEENEK